MLLIIYLLNLQEKRKMKEKIKAFLVKNWKSVALIIGAAVLLCIFSCGSTWKITDNKVGVVVMKNDTLKCPNDTLR